MTTASMRVLLVAAATSTTGGGEKHVADLLHRLPAQGIEIALVCPQGGDLTKVATRLGIPVWHAPLRRGFSLGRIRAVRRAIDEFAPHVVHAHGPRATLFASLADPQARERVVYTMHGIHVSQAGSKLRRIVFLKVERRLRSRVRCFVTVCRSDVTKGAALDLLDESRTVTVYNGIELPVPAAEPGAFREQTGVAGDAPLVLSVGRFHEQKDQAMLLRAWALVLEEQPNAILALVGSGVLESSLRELAAALALGDTLRFVPPRPGLASAYLDADVFVLSSLWEGLPYVILEAMAYGLPVVSTEVDGIPEMVVDGETGVLVPPRDEQGLAHALTWVLEDAEMRTRMGKTGAARVTDVFTLEHMIDGLVAVYLDVARGAD